MFARPRIVLVGEHRPVLGGGDAAALDALSRVAGVHPIDAAATPSGMLRALRDGARAIIDGCEAVHLLDARLAVPALLLRSRFGVPVSVTLSESDIASGTRKRTLARLDHGFAHSHVPAPTTALRRLPLSVVPPISPAISEPSKRQLESIGRLTRDATPGRLVVVAPWPVDAEQVRWCRDAVAPMLQGNPLWIFIGAPGRRQVRLMAGAIGMNGRFRAHVGRVNSDVIASAARCADVFVVAGEAARVRASTTELLLALVASRVPLVAGGGIESGALDHERDAFVAPAGDASGLVATVNQLLALPAVQRHYLGEEFAAHAAQRYTWDAASEIYGARFAAMVGRPQIPAELRAA